jgi:hypothetical protein
MSVSYICANLDDGRRTLSTFSKDLWLVEVLGSGIRFVLAEGLSTLRLFRSTEGVYQRWGCCAPLYQ